MAVVPALQDLTQTLGDLRECNQEKIHLFAAIQGRGCLVGFTWPDQRVQLASKNVGDVIGIPHAQVLGARLEHFLGPEFVAQVTRTLRENDWKQNLGRALQAKLGDRSYDAFMYESEGLYVLEFEATAPSQGTLKFDNDQSVRDFMLRAKDAASLKDLAKVTARAIRDVTGFDRVMIYRFLRPSYHGEVIAEDRVAGAHSFDGHRFPSSDIPKPARDLYLRNSVRMIPDIHQPDAEIEPAQNPLTRTLIDLSDSRLRAVSKIHLEYLRNMGVQASYSFAIVSGGQLWGLVACHHLSPYRVDQAKILACEIITSAFSSRAEMLEGLSIANERLTFDGKLMRLFDALKNSSDPVDEMFRQHRQIEGIFRVTGIAYVSGARTDLAGLTPPRADLEEIAKTFHAEFQKLNRDVVSHEKCDFEGEVWARARQLACGVLGVRVPGVPDGVMLFFRPELVRTIVWGGDPRKQLEKKAFEGRINPRVSFSTWEETVREQSLEWAPFEAEGALFLRDYVFDVLARRESLISELSAQVRQLRGK